MRAKYALFIAVLVLGAAALACGCTDPSEDGDRNQTDGTAAATQMGVNLTIGEVLVGDGNFSAFTRAIDAAGLERVLAGPGPYTVFAPTDEAFSRLPEAVMQDLSNDPKGNLAEVLLYHMAPGTYTRAELATNGTIATVQGNSISVDADGKNITVNGVEIIRVDIQAINGVIHAIDTVMVPSGVTLSGQNETAANVTMNVTG
ncbi:MULTISPECIES: fasciclin domain-containing protein [unclassified Methanoculleus]|jgi:uncharacterized surface protein with fasciclin (FAS1) repeats|uniref:fasciclin domain-containing protein n=1 Tax=unclassified Methanoculleus TaxID=2619537 RepID=UPI0025E4BBD7|nr:fasciclin domain-containing protein [Methanoculleus sp. UBA377]MDD2473377.1 fasciclin domain-containing protein [Methanoculleus sp.]